MCEWRAARVSDLLQEPHARANCSEDTGLGTCSPLSAFLEVRRLGSVAATAPLSVFLEGHGLGSAATTAAHWPPGVLPRRRQRFGVLTGATTSASTSTARRGFLRGGVRQNAAPSIADMSCSFAAARREWAKSSDTRRVIAGVCRLSSFRL